MNIIIVFPKTEQAKSMRGILQKAGYTVDAVCTSGAQALRAAGGLESGIVICPCRLPDMAYSELHECLMPHFDMLLIGTESQIAGREAADIAALSTPLKVYELLQAVELLSAAWARRKKKEKNEKRKAQKKPRSVHEQHAITQAKALLMEQNRLSEEEAHRYLQKRSMDNGTAMYETAQMIISLMGHGRQPENRSCNEKL